MINTTDWTIAGPALDTITDRLIDAPNSTSPVLMKNSVRNPPDSRSRTPVADRTALPSSPRRIA